MFDQIVRNVLSKVISNPQEISHISDTDDLIALGLTSLGFIHAIVELESACGIEFPDSMLLFENFNTIEKIKQALEKLARPVMKCVVLDCDDVLWSGVAGEPEGITSMAHNRSLHTLIRDLSASGVFICLCTRNSEDNICSALKIVDLSQQLFAECVYDCFDKPAAIKTIAEKLNLGLDSFLYIDDDPYQLGLVKSTCSSVQTMHFTVDIDMNIIRSMFLDDTAITPESKARLTMYREQKEREQAKSDFATTEEYIASLNEKVVIGTADATDLARVAELSQRTNQFNLTLKRYSEEDFNLMLHSRGTFIYVLRVFDRFGDMGIVGAALLVEDNIEGFWFSCRALGRGFEVKLLDYLKADFPNLKGKFVLGSKNERFADFFIENGIQP